MPARSKPSAPDLPGALRPRSGPVDVPVGLLVAARNGDPGAFARFVEHWDEHVRPFVHHVLAGDGPTEAVLAAAYVRAYRALPRYRAEQTPGLWLHRIAYLATVDELRRSTRDPSRRRARTHPAPPAAGRAGAAADAPLPDTSPVAVALRRLAPDQRALALLVDLEGFREDAVADAFATGSGVLASRLASARRVLDRADDARLDAPGTPLLPHGDGDGDLRGRTTASGGRADPAGVLGGPLVAGSPDAPPAPTTSSAARPGRAGSVTARLATGRDDDLATPSWFDDESVRVVEADEPSTPTDPPSALPTGEEVGADAADPTGAHEADPEGAEVGRRVGQALAALAVPPASATFWADLGRRLIAERERPAAPPPDPVARLARAHPAELGFRPTTPDPDVAPPTVSSLAHQAAGRRGRRNWARPLGVVAAVLLLVGVVVAAVSFGTSSRPRDGSVATAELATTVAEAFDASPYLAMEATVVTPGSRPEQDPQVFRVTLGPDGSWVVSRDGALDQVTRDGTAGVLRQVLVLPGTGGAAPQVLATEETGLAAGAPDPSATPTADGPLTELQAVGPLLRAAGDQRAAATTTDGMRTWTTSRTLATGPDGERERWLVAIRRSDGLPVRVDRRRDGALLRRVTFRDWEGSTEVPLDTFAQPFPDGTAPTATDHGFTPAELPAVAFLGRGDAVTPGWLPDGFELATVALRPEAPAGATRTGRGENPPDVAVASLGYQRGPERITVSFRGLGGAPAGDWSDPFRTAGGTVPTADAVTRRTLGDGRYNQTRVSVTGDAIGRGRLWGIADDTVFTVSGDLTEAEAYRVASSLR